MSAVPIPSYLGEFRYGSATLGDATNVCEITDVTVNGTRVDIASTSRCSTYGHKVYAAGMLEAQIDLELDVLKSASDTSETDDLLAKFLGSDPTLDHCFVVDNYDDGWYFPSMAIINCSMTQSSDDKITYSISLRPADTDFQQVLNGTLQSLS